jgi:hypothetical protein
MKQYIGVKWIKATPLDKDGQPGYEVEYEGGYRSWSPKDVFEKAYWEVASLQETLAPHIQRMVEEKAVLEARITKLEAFLPTPVACALPNDERVDQHRQLAIMKDYALVLSLRLARAGVSQAVPPHMV